MSPASGGESLSTASIARKLLPLYFTHINQAILTTLPFTVAVYMVRGWEASRGSAVSEQAVGRATGMLAAVFCAAQLVTSYPWGIISDRIGRKPVLVVGNISCVVSVLAFGLAGTYWQAILARVVGGLLNAIILAEKAMIGEGLPSKDAQAKAFGLMSLCWGLGSLAGPMIGGSLSAPCTTVLRIEALCGEQGLLVLRPYFLPCLLAGVLSGAATVMTIVGLEETLPTRRAAAQGGSGGSAQYQQVPAAEEDADAAAAASREVELSGLQWQGGTAGKCSSSSSSSGASSNGLPQRPGQVFRGDSAQLSPGQASGRAPGSPGSPAGSQRGSRAGSAAGSGSDSDVIVFAAGDLDPEKAGGLVPAGPDPVAQAAVPWYRQRSVITTLAGYGLTAWLFNILDELTPIYASASVADGGLGFTPSQLAPSLSFGGLVLVVWALRGFPWLMRRVGVVHALRMGLWHSAPMALLMPCTSLFHGAQLPSQAGMFAVLGCKAVTATNAFTGCLIAVNAAAPVEELGAVNGAGQAVASLVRALGPALGGLSWAWSLQLAEQRWWPGWLPHQYLPFAFVAFLCLCTDCVYWGFQMPDAQEVSRNGGDAGKGSSSSSSSMHAPGNRSSVCSR